MNNNTASTDIEGRVWSILFIGWAVIAGNMIITFSYGMMLPDVRAEFGLSVTLAGQIASMYGLMNMISTIPISLLANRFNPRFTIPILCVIIGAGMICFGAAVNVPMLFIGRVLTATVYYGFTACLVIFKVRHIAQERIVGINGIENFIGPIGQTIATLAIAPILVMVGGWRHVYIGIGVFILLCAGAWLLVYRDDKFKVQRAAAASEEKPKESYFVTALKQKTFWLLALGWPGTTLIWIASFYYWPTYAMETLGITRQQAGFALSFIPIFSAIASLIAPRITKIVGVEKPFIWTWGWILPMFYFMMTQTGNMFVLCLCTAVAGLGAYFWVPIAFSCAYKLGLHPRVVSCGTAMILTGVAFGTWGGGQIVAWLIRAFDGDLRTALMVCCLSPLTLGILGLFLPERGRKQLEKEALAKAS
jgi:MFS family permease